MKLQDEALLYLRDNITREEAYYILTTENEMTEVLIAKKEDGSKRIKILDMEYTIERDDMLLLFDTDGIIDECLLTSSHIGINMYFRRQDIRDILSKKLEVMEYRYMGRKESLNIKNRRKRYVKIRQGRYRNIYTRSYRY